LLDQVFVADIALMGVVQEILEAVERYVEARAVRGGDAGADVVQQGLYFAPVDVATDRVMENGMQQAAVFVAHGVIPSKCSNYCGWGMR